MRKEYGKAFRAQVERCMGESAFGWRLHKEKSIYAVPGERAFRRDMAAGLVLWCFWVPYDKWESFTVEIGWSRLERYPQLSMRPSFEGPDDAHGRDEYAVRLGQLSRQRDQWWEVEKFVAPTSVEEMMRTMQPIAADQAGAAMAPRVEEALADLVAFGEPFLMRVAGLAG